MVFPDRAGPRIALVQEKLARIPRNQTDQMEYQGSQEDAGKSQAGQGGRIAGPLTEICEV